jgi:cupin 2 domain-containing protein
VPLPTVANLFAELPPELTEELFETLAGSASVKVERIVSPPGSATPAGSWYDQELDEWVVLLRGRAVLQIEGEPRPVELGPGDHLLLPAHLRHRVAWTAEDEVTVWLAVHFR